MKKNIQCILVFSILLFSCKTDKKNIDIEQTKTAKIDHKPKPKIDSIITDTILGIDVSHFQGDIDWTDIKNDNVQYAYIKATEGTDFKDPKFSVNWTEAKKNNIYRGAYHFYETGDDPIQQAKNFLETIGQFEAGELPPVLDLEAGGIQTKIDKETYQKYTLQWLQFVAQKLGVTPIIYTNLTFGNEYLNNSQFTKYKLWIAEYTNTNQAPIIPDAWQNKGWIFWQRTDLKKLKGIDGDIDYDLFNGNSNDFSKLIN